MTLLRELNEKKKLKEKLLVPKFCKYLEMNLIIVFYYFLNSHISYFFILNIVERRTIKKLGWKIPHRLSTHTYMLPKTLRGWF